MAKKAAELYKERKQRVLDAIALKVPDRVPIYLQLGVLGAKYAGITVQEAFESTDKWLDMNEKVFRAYEPDFYSSPSFFDTVANSDLDNRMYRWPGHGIGPNSSYQFVEGEYMKAEEYDIFLNDPGDFIMRTYLPRIYGNLTGLSKMRALLSSTRSAELLASFSQPEVLNAFKLIIKAAEHYSLGMKAIASLGPRMEALGYPDIVGWGSQAPFDFISDLFRGLRGGTLDLFRCPDKLIAAQEKVLPYLIEPCLAQLNMTKMPLCFCALHRGADGFMSLAQFERFYWPGLKKILLIFIEAGYKPFVFWEGSWDQRLKYLCELPKGKVVGWFDRTDLFRAKDILGDMMCICGGMPISLLTTGTAEQVRAYAKRLIDEVGKGGGYIMSSSVELSDAKPELVKAMVDFTREYGVYR